VTAGTLFDRRRTPLTVWFTPCWMFATGKDSMSALSLQRALEIGSYPTAWAMLHRLRSVLVRPGRERLTGMVEVDETFIGGEEAGLRGGRARGKKVLTGIAVRSDKAQGHGSVPDGAADRCLRQVAACLRHRPRRAGREGDHRRLAGLSRPGGARLRPRPTQPTRYPGARAGPWRDAARGAPSRLADQAVAARYSSGHGGGRPSAQLHRRVRISASTGAEPAAEGWSSTGYSNSTSPTTRCIIATWLSTLSRRRHHPRRLEDGDIRRAWTARERLDHSEPLTWAKSAQMNSPEACN
jgi:hypothetical protein